MFKYFFSVFYILALSYSDTAEEKQTSILKPAHGDVDAAKVAAMQAAELGNAVNMLF